MQKQNLKIILTLASFLSLPNFVFGAPSINGVSGTFSHGQSVTISGSDFGFKEQAAPWLYDSFENYTPGTGMDGKSPQIGTITYERYSTSGTEGIYADDVVYSGNQASKTVNSNTGSTTTDHFAFRGQAAQKRFISYRRYRTGAEGVFKGDRQAANLGNGNNNNLYDSPPNFGRDGYIFTNNGLEFVNHGYLSGEADNVWQRIDQWIVISTPDVANGRYDYYIDNILRRSTGGYVTCTSAATNGCQIDSWISPNYVNKTGTITFWIDDLYVDNTQARVELCSGIEWSSKGNCDIQIPSDWSTTSNTITINQGSFSDGDTAYLYVIDENGGVNEAGYPITFSSSEDDAIAPSSPIGLGVI